MPKPRSAKPGQRRHVEAGINIMHEGPRAATRPRLRRGTRVVLFHWGFEGARGEVIFLTRRTVNVRLDCGVSLICDRWQVVPA